MYTTLATILALATSASAKPASNSRTFAVDYFYGDGPLLEGRYDPIISPGELSGHVHTIMGGSGFALKMDADSGINSNCTNSKPKADGSNYWWPKLYFHDPNNGSFVDVDLYYAKVYYFAEPTDDETKAFPPGLQMLTGDAMKRSSTSQKGNLNIDPAKGDINSVQFMCGMTDKSAKPFGDLTDTSDNAHGAGFPDANCDGYTTPLRYDLHFPSCYNPSAGLTDYKNNMAWPSSKGASQGQNCPDGYIHVPHLFIEVYWNTPVFADRWTPGQGKQPFVLAQGDPTGFGLHADFISGWKEDELQALIDGCDAGDAGFDKCPTIDANGGVNPSEDRCVMQPLAQETITGVLDKLPGCNPLQAGPEDATPQTGNCGGTIIGGGASSAAPVASSTSGTTVAEASATSVAAASSAEAGSASASTPTSAVVLTPATTSTSTTAKVATTLATATAKTASSPPIVASSSSSSKKHHPHHTHAKKPSVHVVYATETKVVQAYVTVHPRALGWVGTA